MQTVSRDSTDSNSLENLEERLGLLTRDAAGWTSGDVEISNGAVFEVVHPAMNHDALGTPSLPVLPHQHASPASNAR